MPLLLTKPSVLPSHWIRAPHWQPPRLAGCRWLCETSALKSQLCDCRMKDPSGPECWLHTGWNQRQKITTMTTMSGTDSAVNLFAHLSESSNGRQALPTAVVTASDWGYGVRFYGNV